MARIINSPLLGLSGTLGNLIFKTYGGKTFIYLKSEKPKRQTKAQQATRLRFTEASIQAKAILEDNNMRLHYEQEASRLNLPNAYTAALRDQLLSTRAS